MASIETLVHEMNVAAGRAAQLRSFGEYEQAEYFDHAVQRASDAIERQTVHREFATTADAQAAAVRERGVS